jgi:NAD(P)H-dependent FMN reductase
MASYNRALLNAAAGVMPEGAELELLSINDVPPFNEDDERQFGLPDSVKQLRERIGRADGIVIATPEYNAGVPGVLKNAIDWLSRRVEGEGSIFSGKPLAMMGATPGGLGTALSQGAWLPTLRNLRLMYWTGGGNFMLSRAGSEFSDGALSPEKTELLATFMRGFVQFVRDQQSIDHGK